MISDNMVCHLLLNKEYFNSVLNEIDNAKYSINVSMFYFSHSKDKSAITSKLFDAISSAHKRGVKIRFILDRDKPSDIYKSYKANKQRFYDLKGLGILVKYDKKESASHSKLIIIDDEKTIICSHNWTYGSFEKYQDISVLIESKKLAESFVKIFSSRFDALD
ncbi:MAG: hypothetical protein IPP01_04915 [Saprospiraceae bacterium]|nr:hypothetical protein [Saprospiraceae bacterium]